MRRGDLGSCCKVRGVLALGVIRFGFGCPQVLRGGFVCGLLNGGFHDGLSDGFPHTLLGLGLGSRGGLNGILLHLRSLFDRLGCGLVSGGGGCGKLGLDGVTDADLAGLGGCIRKVHPLLRIVEGGQGNVHDGPLAGDELPHGQRTAPGEGGFVARGNGAHVRASAQGEQRHSAAQIHVCKRQSGGGSVIHPRCQVLV